MKMHQVGYFLALCEEQSFTRAARRCGVAQPSLTRAIQQLERELGCRLFDRNTAGVRLTKLGTLLRPDFSQLQEVAGDIARKARELTNTHSIEPGQKQWGQYAD